MALRVHKRQKTFKQKVIVNSNPPQIPLLHAVIELVRKLDFELTEQRWQSSEYQQLRELEPLLYQMQKRRRLVHEEVA